MTDQPRGPVDWARQQAAEREEQTADSAWTPLRARAFNAVQPALRHAGEWLPFTARRAVADAVLAELKRELDALAEYENTINWSTTCTSCARVLDSAYAERAEAAIARVRALADVWKDAPDPLARAMAADLLSAVRGPQPAHDAGPSVRECAANDRRWPLEKHGE